MTWKTSNNLSTLLLSRTNHVMITTPAGHKVNDNQSPPIVYGQRLLVKVNSIGQFVSSARSLSSTKELLALQRSSKVILIISTKSNGEHLHRGKQNYINVNTPSCHSFRLAEAPAFIRNETGANGEGHLQLQCYG